MNAPSAAAWSPPPKVSGMLAALCAWTVGDRLLEALDRYGHVFPSMGDAPRADALEVVYQSSNGDVTWRAG